MHYWLATGEDGRVYTTDIYPIDEEAGNEVVAAVVEASVEIATEDNDTEIPKPSPLFDLFTAIKDMFKLF